MPSLQLPDGFLAMLSEMQLDELKTALSQGEPCTSVRLNTLKGVTKAETEFNGAAIPWCASGMYLDERPRFTFDPALHQGCYYVQEASSMIHGYIVGQLFPSDSQPIRVLDSCAAPGGKTTAVIDSMPPGSLMVANEYVPVRAAVLRENIIKWAYPSCIVTRGDTAAFRKMRDTFDLVIADVPCSGEGMMRKDEDAVAQWSPGLIRECAERQWEIVTNLWDALAPGGYLIYSTCTFNRIENEETVSRIINELGGESVRISVPDEWRIAGGIDTAAHCLRFMPHRLRGEGLFVAVIRKPGTTAPRRITDSKDKKRKVKTTPQIEIATSWLSDEARDSMDIYATDDRINAFPRAYADVLKRLRETTDVIHEGVLVGTVKGRDLIPSQSLALSPCLRPDAFPVCEIDRQQALSYLAGEAVTLPEGFPRGFVLLSYRNRPLGFVKNIGNRSNNLYPAPWRIRSRVS